MVAERQATMAASFLPSDAVPTIRMEYSGAPSPGSGITLWARHEGGVLGASALGGRGVPAERVGERAAKQLLELLASEAVVDEHAADQLVPILGLHGGALRTSRVTAHARSNILVTEQFLPVRFRVDEKRGLIRAERLG